jgi:hypothetical protein
LNNVSRKTSAGAKFQGQITGRSQFALQKSTSACKLRDDSSGPNQFIARDAQPQDADGADRTVFNRHFNIL